MYHPDLYDVLAAAHWEHLRPVLEEMLRPASATPGVVVDLGSGTGVAMAAVASALPEHEVVACEPDRGLRACLATRTLALGLADRVTVRDWDAATLTTRLEEPVGAFLALNMLGHLSATDRARLWAWLDRWLSHGGSAIVGPFAEHRVTRTLPHEEVYARQAVGRLVYEGTSRPELLPGGGGRWHMTARVLDGDEVVEERRTTSEWPDLDADDVRAELAQTALAVAAGPEDLLLVRRAGDVL